MANENPHPRYNLVKPPSFFGKPDEDCKAHWLKFQDYYEEVNVPEDQRIAKFRITLYGVARTWYELNKATFIDLATLENAFLAEYLTQPSRAELLKIFNKLQMGPGETLVAFRNE